VSPAWIGRKASSHRIHIRPTQQDLIAEQDDAIDSMSPSRPSSLDMPREARAIGNEVWLGRRRRWSGSELLAPVPCGAAPANEAAGNERPWP